MTKDEFLAELLSVVQSSIQPISLTIPNFVPPKSGKGDEEEACLVLSDVHLGEENPKYNLRIARKRIAELVDTTVGIVGLHRHAYPVNRLNLFLLGDIISGESIFPTQPHHIETGVVEQVFSSVPFLVEQLAVLCANFKEVRVHCVIGNHGRAGKFYHEESNFDRVMYYALRQATVKVKNLSWVIPQGWYLLAKVLNTKVLCIHGHQIKMTLNLPFYGVTTRISRWATTRQIGSFDVALMGHFHTSFRMEWNNKTIFINGTTVDGDEFALEKMGLESSQAQWLFGVHPRHRITWSYQLGFK